MTELNLSKIAIYFLVIVFLPFQVIAQQASRKSKLEVETNWPGIRFKLDRIERILDERLLVVVRIIAMPDAPPNGTLIGINKPSPDATEEQRQAGRVEPRPLSFVSSVMIDDLTSQRFAALQPVFPPGKEYAPAEVLAYLSPGRAEVFTLQFKAPPAADAGAPRKQTVSLLLTNAKGPISAIPLPPAETRELSVSVSQP